MASLRSAILDASCAPSGGRLYVAGSADEIIAIIDTGVACEYFAAMPELSEKLRKIVGTMVKCSKR